MISKVFDCVLLSFIEIVFKDEVIVLDLMFLFDGIFLRFFINVNLK